MTTPLDVVLSDAEQLLLLESLCYLHDVKKEALETALAAGIKIKGRDFTEADFGITEIKNLLAKFNEV
ncbi:hypothetical protein L0936_19300 [Paracidovorax citrulli]